MSLENAIKPFPLSDITDPKDGAITCINNYWLTKDGNAFKSKKTGAFQRNRDKRVVDHVYADLLKSGYEITFIPIAYISEGGAA